MNGNEWDKPVGVDRRTVLRRGTIAAGALVWVTPAVQSIAAPAFAAGSVLCETVVEVDDCELTYEQSPDCCDCVEDHPDLSLAEALALCADQGRCIELTEVCGEEEEEPPPPDNPPPPNNPPPNNPPPNNPPPNNPPPGPGQGDEDVDVPTVFPAGQ